MNNCKQHIFQVLTKRSERLLEMSDELTWSRNIWMGVTVENRKTLYRVKHLTQSGAIVKFLSLEPLLEAIPDLDLFGIDWAIIGGESGPKARPMAEEWVREIRDYSLKSGVPFFFKQWGGVNKKKTGRLLDNQIWSEKPLVTAVSG